MPDTVVDAPPFVPVKPLIKIGATGSTVEIACAAGELAVEVDQDETTTETFCGVFTSYKPEVWTITITVFPSYGTNGLWTLLRPLVGTTQPFQIAPDAETPTGTADNPLMFGDALIKAFPFYTGTPGEPTSFDVELGVQGTPSFAPPDTAPVTAEASTTTGSSSSSTQAAAA